MVKKQSQKRYQQYIYITKNSYTVYVYIKYLQINEKKEDVTQQKNELKT